MKSVQLISKKTIQEIYKPVQSSAHKGTLGHALIIGGSYGKIGSVCLSSKAALKTGCGLVSVFLPQCGYQIAQIATPEVMTITDKDEKHISNIVFDCHPNAIAIGPGMGQERATKKAFYQFLKSNKRPLVIDADALNILASNQKWLSLLQPKTILTPHLKELERLIGTWQSASEKFEMTQSFAKLYDVIVVMKGAPTYIIDSDKIYQNTTGNAALATAGSGDVLTGMISSFLAQSYEPINAAIFGVYLHGLTADLALPTNGSESFIASTIIDYLGTAFLSLR